MLLCVGGVGLHLVRGLLAELSGVGLRLFVCVSRHASLSLLQRWGLGGSCGGLQWVASSSFAPSTSLPCDKGSTCLQIAGVWMQGLRSLESIGLIFPGFVNLPPKKPEIYHLPFQLEPEIGYQA